MIVEPWVIYAIMNAFFTSFGVTNFRYLSQISDNVTITLAHCLVLTGVVSLIYLIFNKKKTLEYNRVVDSKKLAIHMVLFVGFIITTRFLFIKSIQSCPNIGYTHIIVNMNAIISLILAYFIFGQKINIYTFGGILLCVLGLLTIIKYA
jgi:drug/metabolite transporter (DMT)-like permease